MQLPPIVGASINAPVSGNVAMPDVQAVTDAVNQTNQNIQTNLPPPSPGSASQVLGNEVKQVGSSLADTLMNNWQIPVGLAAVYGVYKLLGEGGGGGNPPDGGPPSPPPPPKRTMRDRMLLGEVKEPTLDPFEIPEAGKPAAPTTEAPPKPMLSEREMQIIRDSERNKEANRAAAAAKAAAASQASVPQATAEKLPSIPDTASAGPAAWNYETASKLATTPTVVTSAAPAAPAAPTVEAPPPSTTPEETTKPAPKKRGPKTKEEKLAIQAAIPPSEVGLTKQQLGLKRYLESFYGGGEVGAKTYQQVKDILGYTPAFPEGKGGGLQPEENKIIRDFRKENIQGPKVNLTNDMKKVLKSGGTLAALSAIPGFAEAAQNKDLGKMADIISDFFVLPFAQSSEAGMPKAQEESIIESKFREARKLGSPYRGIAPPGQ
jgi:hypothetical protein